MQYIDYMLYPEGNCIEVQLLIISMIRVANT